MKELDQLIEDYERKIVMATDLLENHFLPIPTKRIEDKRKCYRTFVAELQALKKENRRTIEVYNAANEYTGLLETDRAEASVKNDIRDAFLEAEDSEDVWNKAEEILETVGIYRVNTEYIIIQSHSI